MQTQHADTSLLLVAKFADFIMYTVPPTSEMDLDMVQAACDALSAATETVDYMTAARLGDLALRLDQTSTTTTKSAKLF